MCKSQNRYFYHILVSPGEAPGAITLNVVCSDRFVKKNIGGGSLTGKRVEAPQALTCNTNTGVRIGPQELKSTETRGVKIIIGRVEPPNTPGKSDPGCMDGKRIRCLQIVSLHCAHLSITVSEIQQNIREKIGIFHTPLYSMPPLGGFPSEYCHAVWCGKTRMVWLPDGEKISNISL